VLAKQTAFPSQDGLIPQPSRIISTKGRFVGFIIDAFARKPKGEWLSKKRQMQGAQLSRNEAYLDTPQ
jgi:hypothetical protein